VPPKDDNDNVPAERTEVVSYDEARRRAQASAPRQLGRYRLDGMIAQGGMAEIWLATVEGPGRFEKKVVVKRIRPSLAKQAQTQAGKHIEMFVREAHLLARLEHKNIVQVIELGIERASRPGEPDEHYIVMERLEGLTLRDVALRTWQAGRPLPIELVVRFVADACLGLAHAHGLKDDRGQPANLVHRDISPDNLFITRAGVTKLLDFGIAKREDLATLTTTGELKGKVPYMAPEQLTGARLDARTDLFAIGVVLYWLLCGRRPFDGPSDVFTMKAILDDPPRPVRALNPAVPPLLADVVMACLEKDPARRIGSAAALHDTLSVLSYGLSGPPPDPVAFVAAAEALPAVTYELSPDVAATCAQRWPGSLPAAPSTSAPPSLADAQDASKANTMQVPMDGVRLQAVRVAPIEARRGAAKPLASEVDFDDAPTLPPGSLIESTAEGPAASSGESAVTARPAAPAAQPRESTRAAEARLAEEPTVVRRAPPPPQAPLPLPLPLPPPARGGSPVEPGPARPADADIDLNDTVELSANDPRLGLPAAAPPLAFAQPPTLPALPLPAPPSSAPPSSAPPSSAPPSSAPPSSAPPSSAPPSTSAEAFPSAATLIAAAQSNAPRDADDAPPAPAGTHRSWQVALVIVLGVVVALAIVLAGFAVWQSSTTARAPTSVSFSPGVVVDAGAAAVTVGVDAGAGAGAGSAGAAVVVDAGDEAAAVVVDAGAAAVVVDAGDDAAAIVADAGAAAAADIAPAGDDVAAVVVDGGEQAAVVVAEPSDPAAAAVTAGRPAPVDPRSAGAVLVRARPGTRVVIDDRSVGKTPLRAQTLAAGRHKIELAFGRRRMTHDVDVVAGRVVVVRGDRGGPR
jgi:serine/threonine-protein kinase